MANYTGFPLIDLHPSPADLAAVVLAGLARCPKQLPAWLLYNSEGSALFDQICLQPEYTLTSTELELLHKHAAKLCKYLPAGGLVLEFGAGSAEKVGPLLDVLADPAYLAIDINANHLQTAGARLQACYPHVPMLGICADFSGSFDLANLNVSDLDKSDLDEKQLHLSDLFSRPRLGFFPVSSLGNYEPEEAIGFLRQLRQLLGPKGLLLIGIDQPKQRALLEAAYNDAAGVSAAFASNLLLRLQRDLKAELNPAGFSYLAQWQEKEQRIAMALVSREPQRMLLLGEEIFFAAGEQLITEYSYKYSPEAFQNLAARAGWQGLERCCDATDGYSLHLLG